MKEAVGKENLIGSGDYPSQNIDCFLLDRVYPDPGEAFLFQPKGLSQIKQTATVFLDTNVLLLPYLTGKSSLASIKSVYS